MKYYKTSMNPYKYLAETAQLWEDEMAYKFWTRQDKEHRGDKELRKAVVLAMEEELKYYHDENEFLAELNKEARDEQAFYENNRRK